MPTVSELKEKARSYEREGQVEKALAIYVHILKHLEGKPAIAKVVPLFVKLGDLHLKLDHSADAVAAYERAAEHYAAQGSSQRVVALCTKIVGVQPGRLGVHAKFARQLVKHGHVGSATDVLMEYAQDAKLDKAVEVLDELEGRPDAEVKPMLESLLDSIERGEPLKAEETAQRVSTRLSQTTDSIAGELSDVQIETSSGKDVAAVEATEADRTSEPLTPEPIDLGFTTGELATEPVAAGVWEPGPPAVATPEPPAPPAPPAVGAEKPPPLVAARPTPEHLDVTIDSAAAAREWTPPATEPRSEPQKTGRSPAVLVGGGFLVGLLSGVGLAMAGVIPTGGGNGSEAQIASTPPPTQQSDAPAPVTPVADTTAAVDSVADTSSVEDAAIDTTGTADTTGVAAAAPPADSLGTPANTTPPPTPTDFVSVDSTAAAVPIMVEGLTIQSQVEVESQGRAGHRVVQLLDWADPITIESYRLPDDTTDEPQTGPLRVTVTPPDTVVGIMRFNGYQIFASGVMPEDSLRSLLSRLVEGGN